MVGVHALPLAGESERGAAESGIRAYLALAEDLLSPPPPRLICIGGLSGTGKTTVSGRLAPFVGACPGAIHLRSDVERKLMFGVEPTARLEPSAYADAVSQEVHRRLHARALPILRAGHCVIIDAVFRDTPKREAAQQVARDAGAPFLGLWLEADPEQMIARAEGRRNDASDADRAVVSRQLQSGVTRPDGWLSVDAGGDTDDTLARVLALL
jgi:predicted kinase